MSHQIDEGKRVHVQRSRLEYANEIKGCTSGTSRYALGGMCEWKFAQSTEVRGLHKV